MGADIHMVVEKRHRFNNGVERWVGVNAFPHMTVGVYLPELREKYGADHPYYIEASASHRVLVRNYNLFADLAGVRGDGPRPRGLPDDISDLARMRVEEWDADGHSHTWCLMSEAMPLFLKHQFDGRPVGEMLQRGLSEKQIGGAYMRYFYEELYGEDDQTLDDYRLIIWFDN